MSRRIEAIARPALVAVLAALAVSSAGRTALARAAQASCSVHLEDRAQPPWRADDLEGATLAEARERALAGACDGRLTSERVLCRDPARPRLWNVVEPRGGQGRWRASVVIVKPRTRIEAEARGKGEKAACQRAVELACKLVGRAPAPGAAVGQVACQGTRWYVYISGSGSGRGESARFH